MTQSIIVNTWTLTLASTASRSLSSLTRAFSGYLDLKFQLRTDYCRANSRVLFIPIPSLFAFLLTLIIFDKKEATEKRTMDFDSMGGAPRSWREKVMMCGGKGNGWKIGLSSKSFYGYKTREGDWEKERHSSRRECDDTFFHAIGFPHSSPYFLYVWGLFRNRPIKGCDSAVTAASGGWSRYCGCVVASLTTRLIKGNNWCRGRV